MEDCGKQVIERPFPYFVQIKVKANNKTGMWRLNKALRNKSLNCLLEHALNDKTALNISVNLQIVTEQKLMDILSLLIFRLKY